MAGKEASAFNEHMKRVVQYNLQTDALEMLSKQSTCDLIYSVIMVDISKLMS